MPPDFRGTGAGLRPILSFNGRLVHVAIDAAFEIDPSSLCRRLLHRVEDLRHAPPLSEVAIGPPVLGDRVKPLVDLDGLQLVHAQRDSGEWPEGAIVAVACSELDLAVALPLGWVTREVQPEGVDVLLDKLQRALAPNQFDALVPRPARRDPRRLDVPGCPAFELDQEGGGVVVLDRVPRRVQVGCAAVAEYARRFGAGLDEGSAETGDCADRPNENVRQRDDVCTQVAEGARACELAFEAPREGDIRIGARI